MLKSALAISPVRSIPGQMERTLLKKRLKFQNNKFFDYVIKFDCDLNNNMLYLRNPYYEFIDFSIDFPKKLNLSLHKMNPN